MCCMNIRIQECVYYFAAVGVQSIAVSMSACLSVCLSTGISKNDMSKLNEIFCTLIMAVVQFVVRSLSDDCSTLCTSCLCMASCLPRQRRC